MLLLEACAGAPDIGDAEELRRLLQALREVRQQKTVAGLKTLDGDPLRMTNIADMELNEIRPFLLPAMDQLVRLRAQRLAERSSAGSSATTATPASFYN